MITFCPLLISAPKAMSSEALLYKFVLAEACGMEKTSFRYAWAIEEALSDVSAKPAGSSQSFQNVVGMYLV